MKLNGEEVTISQKKVLKTIDALAYSLNDKLGFVPTKVELNDFVKNDLIVAKCKFGDTKTKKHIEVLVVFDCRTTNLGAVLCHKITCEEAIKKYLEIDEDSENRIGFDMSRAGKDYYIIDMDKVLKDYIARDNNEFKEFIKEFCN